MRKDFEEMARVSKNYTEFRARVKEYILASESVEIAKQLICADDVWIERHEIKLVNG